MENNLPPELTYNKCISHLKWIQLMCKNTAGIILLPQKYFSPWSPPFVLRLKTYHSTLPQCFFSLYHILYYNPNCIQLRRDYTEQLSDIEGRHIKFNSACGNNCTKTGSNSCDVIRVISHYCSDCLHNHKRLCTVVCKCLRVLHMTNKPNLIEKISGILL